MLPQVATQLRMTAPQIATVLVTLLILSHAIQTEYFVKSNETTWCPVFPCYTLSHYLENITQYFTSNTRINFLHGVHEISNSGEWLIKNVFSLTLTGYKITGSNTAKIIILCMQYVCMYVFDEGWFRALRMCLMPFCLKICVTYINWGQFGLQGQNGKTQSAELQWYDVM